MDPADLPRDGRGGYLYTQNISIPNYANTTTYTTYSTIDNYLFTNSGSATTLGVTFGACLMTLIHVLIFTTPDKRGRIIFNCIVVGLFMEVIRQFCGIWAVTRSGTNNSYFVLTLAPNNATDSEIQAFSAANGYTNFSLGTKVNSIIDALTSVLAFIAIQVCFCVLVQVMMSAMRRKTARIVIISLAVLGFHGVVWRIVQFVWNTLEVFRPSTTHPLPDWLYLTTSVAYTISICAWCLVYGYLVVRSARSRIRLGLEFKRGEARHVMIMTTLESMIIPIMFVVIQWLGPKWFPESEYCVVPSILILLPFGTLWASSFDPNEAHRGHMGRYRPNEDSRSTPRGSNPTPTESSNSRANDSPSQPLFHRKTRRTSGRSDAGRTTDLNTITPAPVAPHNPTNHPLDDLYPDSDSDDTIRIRRQFTVASIPRSPIRRTAEPEQV